ncbi:hypothetical protein J4711_14310 [Staphylococcus epidermidis]|nr:hypothetical protein [Staphylococcus epidermidis]
MARTIVADWLAHHSSVLQQAEMRVVTRTLDETVHMLQRGEVSFSLLYHHAAIAVRLDGRQFSHLNVMSDKLVPVARRMPKASLCCIGPGIVARSQPCALSGVLAQHGAGAAGGRPSCQSSAAAQAASLH